MAINYDTSSFFSLSRVSIYKLAVSNYRVSNAITYWQPLCEFASCTILSAAFRECLLWEEATNFDSLMGCYPSPLFEFVADGFCK